MPLQSVGVNNFTCPVCIPEKGGGVQYTVATINLQAQAPRDGLDSCVNVMTQLLAEFLPDIHSGVFPTLLGRVREQLRAAEAQLEMRFPYFIAKHAPDHRHAQSDGIPSAPSLPLRKPAASRC